MNQPRPHSVMVELFTNRFRQIAEEMGEMLRRTALSTNVKERLDFSCALLDAEGELVVNAPHIPVHLGALGLCVRRVREELPVMQGDVAITNHPAFGGSHLPDITLITPVFTEEESPRLLGYAASRAHHAEIGGIRPGSMPSTATRLAEEGVIIPPMHLVRGGKAQWDAVSEVLTGAPYPTRKLDENLADLGAALAANRRGEASLRALAEIHCADTVLQYMHALKERAASHLREALGRLPDGTYQAVERLDDGSPLAVRVEIEGEKAVIDFAGSAGVHPGNLNATPAIVRSVVIYVLRLLVAEDLPLNEGLMEAIDLRIPAGILAPEFAEDPALAPAVAGGNVETSQRLVDALLRALKLVAGSQGTMNNVIFGNDRHSYYETVCGGSGAGRGFDGADAVQVHMTNTRITDPEILEFRYPVRLEKFGIRRGSGGSGQWKGGDGVVREILFEEKMELSILAQHRVETPYGLEGGEPGKCGRQWVRRSDGSIERLAPIDGCEINPGDTLILETPGGGGFGAAGPGIDTD